MEIRGNTHPPQDYAEQQSPKASVKACRRMLLFLSTRPERFQNSRLAWSKYKPRLSHDSARIFRQVLLNGVTGQASLGCAPHAVILRFRQIEIHPRPYSNNRFLLLNERLDLPL